VIQKKGMNVMGYFSEYLSAGMDFAQLQKERRNVLALISEIRQRPVMVYASDLEKNDHIKQSDKLPFSEILQSLSGSKMDIILQTNGGDATVVEDWVKSIRRRFTDVGVIVPHCAMSAGTIFAMAADEIIMGPESALGPIDGQVRLRGNVISAGAVIKGLEDIVHNLGKNAQLDLALLATLQSLSPGEVTHCLNAQNFSRNLVSDWLERYKFSKWTTHRSTNAPVTKEERHAKAKEIAHALCDQARWLTHSRSIHIEDLRNIGLMIEDYSQDIRLNEAILRYNALLALSFLSPAIKIFESPAVNITLHAGPLPATNSPISPAIEKPNTIQFECEHCHNRFDVDARLVLRQIEAMGGAIKDGFIGLPCPFCKKKTKIRINLEEKKG